MTGQADERAEVAAPSARADRALQLFFEGYSCSQAIAGAFADVLGLTPEVALRLSAGFGGGMGDHKGTCGTVTGMILVAGALRGGYPPDDLTAKRALYALDKALKAEFEGRFGSLNCGELLQRAACLPRPEASARNAAYYAKRPCAHFVEAAARILERHLAGD